jgi:3-oxoacyl-[acyl-carrier-protein] synthase II
VKRVAITGMGALTGYGQGVDALWDGLTSGETAFRDHGARLGRRAWMTHRMASLPDGTASLARGLPNQQVVRHERLEHDPDLLAIADAARQAIADAGLKYDPVRNGIGLVVTHESPGLGDHLQGFFRWGEIFRAWVRSPARFNPAEFLYQLKSESVYRMHSFLYIHYLAALFNLHGFSMYNNNACASGAYALSVAVDRIRSGRTPAAVVVGGDVPEDGTKYRWFEDLGIYSPTGNCKPFSAARDGLVLGSGAAALVLEDLEQARAAGKRIYAEWLGGGFTSEGWKITMPDVAGDRYAEAIGSALNDAGVRPEQIDMITPHGVGSGMLDNFETNSLAEVFGNGGRKWPPMLLAKAAVGHTLGGCVLVELVASLRALQHGEVPPVVRCDEPDPSLPVGPPRSTSLPERWTMLKCTNGFAGQNGAIVLGTPRE